MTATADDMKFTRIANWFGSDAMVRDLIGQKLRGRPLVVIPFAGSMSILPKLTAAKIICSDLHKHLINLAKVMKDPVCGPALYRALRREIFHADTLKAAQDRLLEREHRGEAANGLFGTPDVQGKSDWMPSLQWAADYAICSWMARGGNAGTKTEFNGGLATRYSPDGGGSAQRFQNWTTSIPAWRRVMQRCEFEVADAFDVIAAAHDSPRVAIYVDPPWVGAGIKYVHSFTEGQHRKLSTLLMKFQKTRVVIRYDAHPLIRELYPTDLWECTDRVGRDQQNSECAEVMLINRCSIAGGGGA